MPHAAAGGSAGGVATAAEILTAIDDAIFSLVSTGLATQEFSIAGRDTKFYSLDELRRLRDAYASVSASSTSDATAGRRRITLADVSRREA